VDGRGRRRIPEPMLVASGRQGRMTSRRSVQCAAMATTGSRTRRETAEIPVGIGGLSPFPLRGPVTCLRFLGRGFEVSLDQEKPELVLGRGYPPTVDAHFPFRTVSQRHAIAKREHGSLFVKDNNSHNGIYCSRGYRWGEYERTDELIAQVGGRFRIADIAVLGLDDELERLIKPLTDYCKEDAHRDVDRLLHAAAYWHPLIFLPHLPERVLELACQLHDLTARRERPFVVIDDVPESNEAIDDLFTRANCGTVFLDVEGREDLPQYFVERLFSQHYHLWPILTAESMDVVYHAVSKHLTGGWTPAPTASTRWAEHCSVEISSFHPFVPSAPTLEEPFVTIARILEGDRRPSELPPWEAWLGLCTLRALAAQRRLQRQLQALAGATTDPEKIVGPWPELPGWTFNAMAWALIGQHDDGDHVQLPWFVSGDDGNRRATFGSPLELGPAAVGARAMGLVLGPRAKDADVWEAMEQWPGLASDLSPAPPWFPEGRLWRWVPSTQVSRWLTVQCFGLKVHSFGPNGKAIVTHRAEPSLSGITFPGLVDPLIDAVDAVDFTDERVQAEWSQVFGDHEIGGTESAAAALRKRHRDWIDTLVRTPRPGEQGRRSRFDGVALLGFVSAFLEGAELVWAYDALMERELGVAGFAIGRLRELPDLPRSTVVAKLLRQLTPPDGDAMAVLAGARYLFERGYELELARAKLIEFANAELSPVATLSMMFPGEFAIALLEHVPDAALPVVRAQLRSDDESAATRIAAALVSIGAPWCRAELLAAYAEAVPCWTVVRVALGRLGADLPTDEPDQPRSGLEVRPGQWKDFDANLESFSGIRWPVFES
jgi:FHA domain-containing protein